jgi:hypothetical protein
LEKRDNKGRFIKGNKSGGASKKPTLLKQSKKSCKFELAKACANLCKTEKKVLAILKDQTISMLERLVAEAAIKRNYRHLQWALEMHLGKPKQETEVVSAVAHTSSIKRTDGTVIEYSLKEVEQEDEEVGEENAA